MAPRDALVLLRTLGGSPWLIRHHELVVEAAALLCDGLHGVAFDRAAVLAGAALHDAGKIMHPAEQGAPGHQHEAAGRELLVAHGVPDAVARFCVTHAAWSDGTLEDLLVAAADKLWKGKRDAALEQALVARLAAITGAPAWEVFDRVDTLCEAIAADGPARLARSDS
jgi:HD domain-containing protein